MHRRLILLIPLLGGCIFVTKSDLEEILDPDGDGVPFPEDCDDSDPTLTDNCDTGEPPDTDPPTDTADTAPPVDTADTAADDGVRVLSEVLLSEAGSGTIMAPAGDLDRDGGSWVMIGGLQDEKTNPAVYLAKVSDPEEPVRLLSANQGVSLGFGMALAGLGDVDGDGYPEVAVNAPYFPLGEGYPGAVVVFDGPLDSETLIEEKIATIKGAPVGALAFSFEVAGAVAVVGAMGGGGCDDIAIGAPGSAGHAVHLLDMGCSGEEWPESVGEAWASITDDDTNSRIGVGIAEEVDLSGDGLPDLIVGAPQGDGVVYVFLSPFSGEVSTADADGSVQGGDVEGLGYTLRTAGDLNADGYDDVFLSAEDHIGLLRGSAAGPGKEPFEDLGTRISSDDPDHPLGRALDVGDLDGDGHVELIAAGCADCAVGEQEETVAWIWQDFEGVFGTDDAEAVLQAPAAAGQSDVRIVGESAVLGTPSDGTAWLLPQWP